MKKFPQINHNGPCTSRWGNEHMARGNALVHTLFSFQAVSKKTVTLEYVVLPCYLVTVLPADISHSANVSIQALRVQINLKLSFLVLYFESEFFDCEKNSLILRRFFQTIYINR